MRANQPNTRAGEQQQRTHCVVVTFATSQLPSAWLKFLAPLNISPWEEVKSSVRANQPNTRADVQQQRTHVVVVTLATSHFEMSSLKSALSRVHLLSNEASPQKRLPMFVMSEVSQAVMFPYFTVAADGLLNQSSRASTMLPSVSCSVAAEGTADGVAEGALEGAADL